MIDWRKRPFRQQSIISTQQENKVIAHGVIEADYIFFLRMAFNP